MQVATLGSGVDSSGLLMAEAAAWAAGSYEAVAQQHLQHLQQQINIEQQLQLQPWGGGGGVPGAAQVQQEVGGISRRTRAHVSLRDVPLEALERALNEEFVHNEEQASAGQDNKDAKALTGKCDKDQEREQSRTSWLCCHTRALPGASMKDSTLLDCTGGEELTCVYTPGHALQPLLPAPKPAAADAADAVPVARCWARSARCGCEAPRLPVYAPVPALPAHI